MPIMISFWAAVVKSHGPWKKKKQTEKKILVKQKGAGKMMQKIYSVQCYALHKTMSLCNQCLSKWKKPS